MSRSERRSRRTWMSSEITRGKHNRLGGCSSASWCYIVLAHRGSPMMEVEGSQLVAKEGTLLFPLAMRTNRPCDEQPPRAPGLDERRDENSVRSSSRARSSLLPAFLSFRRYALYGALPVALACTDHHQMAFGNLTRPRATPLRPRKPRHRYLARVTLASGEFRIRAIFMTGWKGFSSRWDHYLSYDV